MRAVDGELVDGEIWANVWQTDRIARIDPETGQVTGWIDLSQLRPRMVPPPKDVEGLGAYGKAVANGIAYDAVAATFTQGELLPVQHVLDLNVHLRESI